ncbi:MAG: hypothetical protein KAI21_04575, partial [Deltaproteobacteria bacterium]|nr:hypothetical protein [Deltaproteobacteria bacterium]
YSEYRQGLDHQSRRNGSRTRRELKVRGYRPSEQLVGIVTPGSGGTRQNDDAGTRGRGETAMNLDLLKEDRF